MIGRDKVPFDLRCGNVIFIEMEITLFNPAIFRIPSVMSFCHLDTLLLKLAQP